jgi:periplasmic protein TonB
VAYASIDNQPRWPGAVAAVAVQGALGLLIVLGLSGELGSDEANRQPALVAFDQPPPSPRPTPTAEPAAPEPAGAPSAAKARAAPREAPEPKIALAEPSPAATKAGSGTSRDDGRADLGGSGTGTGGSGLGAGGGGAATSPPVRVAGGISDRDYPRSAAERGAAGTVAISFRIRRDGRVDDCTVLRSSGDGALDSLTCTLVERRFVYRPARGPSGEARETTERTTFTWGVRGR